MRALLRSLRTDRSGVAAIEFAMIVPMLALLLLGTIEFGRLILLNQKLQNGTFILADLAARDKTLSEGQLTNIFLAIDNVIAPFEFATSGTAIVTSVGAVTDDDPVVSWQRTGAGSFAATSAVGAPGGEAAIPDTLSVKAGETIIVAEVFYDYVPIFGLTSIGKVLHKTAYFRPRLGSLTTLAP